MMPAAIRTGGISCAVLAFVLANSSGWKSQQSVHAASPDTRLGFSSRSIVQERDAEAKYTAQLSTESISEFHRTITKRPHMAGTPASMAVAETIRKGLESQASRPRFTNFKCIFRRRDPSASNWLSRPGSR